ncbi:MAG TPA: hypothetical protein PKJ99_08255 [Thermoanaerobaculales bacterium]|nr:hypothetical protein [Thermoanaerobaculales bacterium]HPA80343.1 hypothetical protein [Thermoanaerobaculales bacterium]HQL28600.1 hypothetical protein [Thermoanaerobaculales bacterium]HQN95766.1 hypothetical protein [Thermoanaerobaculales bacterium]HQP43860.1 hypothetical protein [Thermoanaerobaculales bacterium]
MTNHDAPHGSDLPPAAPPDAASASAGLPDRVDVGGYLNRAWALFTANAGLLVGGFAIVFIILLLSAITVVGPLILAGPLMAGYYGIVQKLRDGREAEFGELFAGFQDFARTCVAGLLVVLVLVVAAAVSMIVGFVLGYIPCLGQILSFVISLAVSVVAGAASMFVIPAIVVTAKAPVEALSDNVRFAQRFVTPAVVLAVVHVALGVIGSLVCLVGLLVTMPVASAFVMEAYHDFYRPRVGG